MHETTRQPVQFDLDTLRLTIGERSTVVNHPALGNEAVLRSYLALVAEVRGTPIGSGIQVRHDDVVVLAQVLDLADDELDLLLARLLGVSAAEAAQVGRRLRRRHAFAAAAASLTVGGLALFGATKVSASPDPGTPARVEPAAAVVSVSEITAPSTTTAPPADVTTTTPVTVTPPHEVEDPAPAPVASDDVQIGDALVIERGQPPADGSTQIGDAVTYER